MRCREHQLKHVVVETLDQSVEVMNMSKMLRLLALFSFFSAAVVLLAIGIARCEPTPTPAITVVEDATSCSIEVAGCNIIEATSFISAARVTCVSCFHEFESVGDCLRRVNESR